MYTKVRGAFRILGACVNFIKDAYVSEAQIILFEQIRNLYYNFFA